MHHIALLHVGTLCAACAGPATVAGAEHLGSHARLYEDEALDRAARDYERECARRAKDAEPGAVPVDTADGIDRCEAQALAEIQVAPLGCGFVGAPQDDGMCWLVPVRVGDAAEPAEPVEIDKATGKASGWPSPQATGAAD